MPAFYSSDSAVSFWIRQDQRRALQVVGFESLAGVRFWHVQGSGTVLSTPMDLDKTFIETENGYAINAANIAYVQVADAGVIIRFIGNTEAISLGRCSGQLVYKTATEASTKPQIQFRNQSSLKRSG